MPRYFGLIPAAGKSVRMGQPKLALPLGGRTILEWVVAALKQAGIAEVLVVIGPHVPELRELAEKAGAQVLLLEEETEDMRATVVRGLGWLQENCRPDSNDFWFLLPADHPTLQPAVIEILFKERELQPQASLLLPTYRGKRGHPALVSWRHTTQIQALPSGRGLNQFFRLLTRETVEVPVHAPEVLLDLDTPGEYQELLNQFESKKMR